MIQTLNHPAGSNLLVELKELSISAFLLDQIKKKCNTASKVKGEGHGHSNC